MEPPQSRRGKKRPRSSENTLPIVSVTKKNERPNLRPQKIIVLGAGVAGLACSRELKQRGYEVLVVEARSRIGGRLKGELLDLGADYPSTLPDSAVKKKPGRPKRTEPSSAVPQTTLTRQHPVDVGGALIHGIQNNPIHQITTQMGVPIHPVSSDCLLMDAHGWPFDPKVDEKVSNFFNECLDVTFTLAEKDRSSLESFGKLFEKVCREKSGGTNTNWETPLLKWHRANLELPSGASFYDLGHTWNEDEPYGFDGVHAAVEPSWRLVMENLSEGLDIVKNAPVREVRIVLPDGTTPLTLGDSNTRITTAKLSPTTVESNDAAHLRTNANSSDNEKQKKDYGIMNTNDVDPMLPTQSEEMIHEELDKENGEKGKSKRRVKASLKTKTTKKSKKAFDPTVAERRFSRRQRNIDVNVRCSSRSTKGRIQRLEYDHDWDESQRRKKRLKTKSGKPIGNANTKTLDNVSTDDVKDGKMKEVREEKPVVYDQSSVVQVALRDGSVLEADALVCTLPLGILKLPQKDPCHVRFVPSLHPTKQKAIKSLGCGLLNKCAISFPTAFWQDSDFLGQAESEHSYLVLNAMKYTQKPILIFMYGGDFAKVVESWTDRDIVEDCLRVLRKICGGTGRQKDIPAPVDYCITRWGKEEFSRMAFTYIPPGIDGHRALKAVGQPVFDPSVPTKPLIMFAGEHTTPYHPSTMHGAFLSGIREAYRFDLSMEPILNKYMKFDDRIHVYKHTFVMKRVYQKTKIRRKKRGDAKAEPKAVTGAVLSSDSTNNATTSEEKPSSRRRGFSGMTLRSRANATSDTTTTNSERKIIDDVAPSTLTAFELENPTSNGTSAKLTKSASLTISRHGGQRSLRGSRKSIDSRTKSSKRISYSIRDPTPKELSKSEMRAKIVEQEDRSLLRAFESYGKESYSSLLQSHILPVYGSIRKRNARQVLEHWERLQHESPSNQSDEAIASHKPISSWLAKDVVYDSWDVHCARIAADVSTEPDGVGSSSITRRSRRGIKRKSF